MSSWVHNPQGKIIAIVREQPKHGPLKSRTSRVGGGVVLVAALVIVVGLMALWPSDRPAALPVSTEREVEDRLIAGVTGSIDGEDHFFALTTAGDGFERPALTIFATDNSGTPHMGNSLLAPVNQLDSDLPAAPGIALAGNIAYIPLAGTDQSALWIVDVSDPESPQELSATELGTTPGSVAVDGDLAAVGPMDGTAIRLFDVSDPERPRLLDTYVNAIAAVVDLTFIDSNLYIANERGITIVDVSSPESADEISRWESDIWTQGLPMHAISTSPRIAAADGHLFAAADVWGVDVLDASNPSDLDRTTRKLSQTQIPQGGADQAIDLAANGDTLYVLWRRDNIGGNPPRWAHTVQKIDVSDPGGPDVVSETADISGETALQSLVIAEDHVYFLNSDRIHAISTSE